MRAFVQAVEERAAEIAATLGAKRMSPREGVSPPGGRGGFEAMHPCGAAQQGQPADAPSPGRDGHIPETRGGQGR